MSSARSWSDISGWPTRNRSSRGTRSTQRDSRDYWHRQNHEDTKITKNFNYKAFVSFASSWFVGVLECARVPVRATYTSSDHRPRATTEQHPSRSGSRERGRHLAQASFEDAQVADHCAVADRPRRGRNLLRQSWRGRSHGGGRPREHPSGVSNQSVEG